MGRKKKKKFKKPFNEKRMGGKFALLEETKQWVWGILLILGAIIIGLSFFGKAGIAGNKFMGIFHILIGQTIFIVPLIFILGALIFLSGAKTHKEKRVFWPIIVAILIIILGLTGILGIFNSTDRQGGWLGYILSWPFLEYFGFWASLFIFLTPIVIGSIMFWQFLRPVKKEKEDEKDKKGKPQETIGTMEPIELTPRPSMIKKFFAPKFKVEQISADVPTSAKIEQKQLDPSPLETKTISGGKIFAYNPPPLALLEKQNDVPTSGDTKVNSAIIKKTLQHFSIEVIMSEINIGPTVTQYTFKPAEGVKLSKITGLSDDLSLALAAHPIRIEAPIPGRSLVGIEIPNKVRAQVRLRDLIENPTFQKSTANLVIPLGKDVSGFPIYTDLTKMPHLLVAGSTGTGKTIFLNSLILSLLYQPSTNAKSAGPEFLRLILVDPKRVEFPVYSNLPHLLCPVIYNATQTINALKWLTGEMERRFDVLAEAKARDIGSFNEIALNEGTDPLPFIVVVIDELADLMAVKGREIEALIARLAQMARAVGIHLVVATQRPSVEVITGLIKANITTRVTFQVASQVDSRTVLDASGAEKLLGSGDLLYISAQVPKPKRVQGAYATDKEVKKVIKYIIPKNNDSSETMDKELLNELEKGMEEPEKDPNVSYDGDEDPLYEEAKQLVVDANKASASLLQRRLRLGYARAARLIDILESRGVVGPAEGSKPREILEIMELGNPDFSDPSKKKDEWNKI